MKFRTFRLLVALPVLVVVLVSQIAAGAQQASRIFRLTVAGELYQLSEVDVGRHYGCAGLQIGILLKDSIGSVLWSLNVENTAGYLAVHGCRGAGTSAASIVGTTRPSREEALWIVKVLHCGASCVGYDVHVFRFSPKDIPPDERVTEELKQRLGLGDVKFAFPKLVFYVNNGYKECPSHWTRMSYRWMTIAGYGQFVLVDAVSYTSQQCYLRHTAWPPDPGQ